MCCWTPYALKKAHLSCVQGHTHSICSLPSYQLQQPIYMFFLSLLYSQGRRSSVYDQLLKLTISPTIDHTLFDICTHNPHNHVLEVHFTWLRVLKIESHIMGSYDQKFQSKKSMQLATLGYSKRDNSGTNKSMQLVTLWYSEREKGNEHHIMEYKFSRTRLDTKKSIYLVVALVLWKEKREIQPT